MKTRTSVLLGVTLLGGAVLVGVLFLTRSLSASDPGLELLREDPISNIELPNAQRVYRRETPVSSFLSKTNLPSINQRFRPIDAASASGVLAAAAGVARDQGWQLEETRARPGFASTRTTAQGETIGLAISIIESEGQRTISVSLQLLSDRPTQGLR